MNAVARVALEIGPVRELGITLVRDGQSFQATAKYFVSYPSSWHRDLGFAPDVTVLSITYEDGADRKSLPLWPNYLDSIVVQVEALELELN